MHVFATTRILAVVLSIFAIAACDLESPEDHLNSAREYIDRGEYIEAEIELKNAIRKDTRSAVAREMLGSIRYGEGDFQGAIKDLTRAVDLGSTDAQSRYELLRSKTQVGRYAEVVGELEDQAPHSAEMHVILGEAYLAAEDAGLARPHFEKSLHLVDGLLGMAKVAFINSDNDAALSYVEKAIEKDGLSREGWLLKGEIELAANMHEEAVASFKTAQELRGGETLAVMGLVRAHLMGNRLEDAQKMAQRLVKLAPNFEQGHYMLAVSHFNAGNLDTAKDALNEAMKVGNSPPSLFLMGATQYQLGDINGAKSSLRRYLNVKGDRPAAYKLLATIHATEGRPAEVVSVLKPVAARFNDAQMWAMLGSALLQTNEPGEATEALQKAVDLAPNMAPFRNQLALGLFSTGDDAGAEAELTAALEIDSEQFQSDHILVLVRLRDGDFDGARAQAQKIIDRDQDGPLGHHLIGSVYLAEGNVDAAKSSFATAVAKQPDYFPASQSLALIAEREGNLAEAERIFSALAERNSERATLALVELALRTGDIDLALNRVAEAVEKFPESIDSHMSFARMAMATLDYERAIELVDRAIELGGRTTDTLLLKGDIYLRSGNEEAAQDVAGELQEMLDSVSSNTMVLAAIGRMHMEVGNLTDARTALERAVASDSGAPTRALAGLVRLELAENNTRAARKWLKQLETLMPNAEEVGLLKGDVLYTEGNTNAALEIYSDLSRSGSRAGTSKAGVLALELGKNAIALKMLETWLDQNPDDQEIATLLATAQVQVGDATAARRHYEALLPTSDPVVLNNLAWIYMTEGDERALEFARLAHEHAPGNPDVADTLGWILVLDNQVEEGLRHLKASALAKPRNASVQYHLGVAYQKIGDVERARNALERALKLGGFAEVGHAREILNSLSQS